MSLKAIMSTELPYFRFTAFQWLNDDISLEDYAVKGVFIDVCAYYWFNDCILAKAKLKRRFSNASEQLKVLFELGLIKENDADDFIKISFLDDQFSKLGNMRKARQDAGRKGGKQSLSKVKAEIKQNISYKDKDKDKDKDIKKLGKKASASDVLTIFSEENKKLNDVKVLTDERKRKINILLSKMNGHAPQFLEDFRKAVKKCQEEPFLHGVNNRNWKASFDFLISNSTNYIKILEGQYDTAGADELDPEDEKRWRNIRSNIEKLLSNGNTVNQAIKKSGVVERWHDKIRAEFA